MKLANADTSDMDRRLNEWVVDKLLPYLGPDFYLNTVDAIPTISHISGPRMKFDLADWPYNNPSNPVRVSSNHYLTEWPIRYYLNYTELRRAFETRSVGTLVLGVVINDSAGNIYPEEVWKFSGPLNKVVDKVRSHMNELVREYQDAKDTAQQKNQELFQYQREWVDLLEKLGKPQAVKSDAVVVGQFSINRAAFNKGFSISTHTPVPAGVVVSLAKHLEQTQEAS